MRRDEEQDTVKRVVSGHLGNEAMFVPVRESLEEPRKIVACFRADSSGRTVVRRKLSESSP